MLGERDRFRGRLGAAVDGDLEPPATGLQVELGGTAPLLGCEEDSLPRRPEREDPVEPPAARKSATGPNASSSRRVPPSRRGVTAAARAPWIMVEP